MTNIQTVAILDDGWTHGTSVYHRGQHIQDVDVDLPENQHFSLSPDEQVERYGRVFYRVGVWEGALYDTGDPKLSPDEKKRLEEANKEILALRKKNQSDSTSASIGDSAKTSSTSDTSTRGRKPTTAAK